MVPQGLDSRAFIKAPTTPSLMKISQDMKGSWFDAQDQEDPTDSMPFWKALTKPGLTLGTTC